MYDLFEFLESWGVGRGEFELYEEQGRRSWLWALCEVPDCPNNVCVRLNDRFCWPHLMTGGGTALIERSDEEVPTQGETS